MLLYWYKRRTNRPKTEKNIMAQLKMYYLTGSPVPEIALPEGYSYASFDPEKDVHAWCECLRNGRLIDGREDEQAYADEIETFSGGAVIPETDIHFLDYLGEHVGTATGFVLPGGQAGDMHQVGIREDFRGKGLAKYLCNVVLRSLSARGVRYISLTTDEFRKGAVKSYLTAGFLPVAYDTGMEERWLALMKEYGISELTMVREDATFYKTLRRQV